MARARISKEIKCFLICFVVAFLLIGLILYKPMLKDATTSDLDSIHGIRNGGVIMAEIQNYITLYPNATVEDLRIIKGVDDMIIDQLKERFR